ncbi:MAG: phage tail assembly protein [Methylophilaceae bacterium]
MKLSKPITNGEEEITEINLREPTGEDVQAIGFPYLILPADGDDHAIELRAKVVAKYISKLGQVPPSVVAKLSAADMNNLMGDVLGFFGMTPET